MVAVERFKRQVFSYVQNWHFSEVGKSHHCDEFEFGLEDVGQLKRILEALDFRLLVTVDKVRRVWRYEDYEVSLDKVEGLGDFVEVEYVGNGGDVVPEKVTGEMIDFLKEVGCGKIMRNYRGYPFQLLFPEETEYEEA